MLEVAKKAALEAGEKILLLRKKGLIFQNKRRLADFATNADLASEKIILEILQQKFPDYNFLSEEIGRINNDSEYTWIIDPLDGTIPYSSGMPSFGISIGLLKNKIPILGVINLPVLGHLLWAEKGKGAYLNGKKIQVSKKKELLKTVVGLEFAYVGMRNKELKEIFSPLVDQVRYTTVLGSVVTACSYVAMGVFGGYLHSAHPWDFAAGTVIIEEAGGKVTDYKGKSLDWTKDWLSVVASNGLIHNKILKMITS